MKRIITALLVLSPFFVFSQISLEKTYNHPTVSLSVVSQSESKYLARNGQTVYVYNVDHTLDVQVNVPTISGYTNTAGVPLVSKTLFDNDPSDYEFLLSFSDGVGGVVAVVFDQSGTVLFQESGNGSVYSPRGSNEAKLILWEGATLTKVYSLPGDYYYNEVPTTSVGVIDDHVGLAAPFPNPTDGKVYINATMLELGDLVSVYNTAGQKVKIVSVNTNGAALDVHELPSGVYSYIVTRKGATMDTGSFVRK